MNTATAMARLPVGSSYVRAWADCLSETLAERLATAPVCSVLDETPDSISRSGDDLWLIVLLSGGLSGEIAFRLPPAFRQILMPRGSGEQATSKGDEAITLEVFNNIAARVSARLRPTYVLEHTLKVASTPQWNPASTLWIQAQLANPTVLEVRLDSQLLACMEAIQPATPAAEPGAANDKLGMFMKVELAVSMRFGGRRMLLRDILELCTGSVVELDQQLQEPVDLLLEGKPIARGEVVVVEGNYGLRITEVLSNSCR